MGRGQAELLHHCLRYIRRLLEQHPDLGVVADGLAATTLQRVARLLGHRPQARAILAVGPGRLADVPRGTLALEERPSLIDPQKLPLG